MPGSFDNENEVQSQAQSMEIVQGEAPALSGNRSTLRAMGDLETQQRALSPNTVGDPLVALFNRIDKDKSAQSEGIDKSEVKGYLKEIGVTKRLFEGTIRKKAATEFIQKLDKNKDDRVSFAEIQAIAAQILPEDVFTSEGTVDPILLDEHFQKTDSNADGQVDAAELEAAVAAALPEGTKNASIKAWVASLVGVDALDSLERDGTISRAELSAMAAQASKLETG
jgi:Ca2+-binding EF-hand superfamily protein